MYPQQSHRTKNNNLHEKKSFHIAHSYALTLLNTQLNILSTFFFFFFFFFLVHTTKQHYICSSTLLNMKSFQAITAYNNIYQNKTQTISGWLQNHCHMSALTSFKLLDYSKTKIKTSTTLSISIIYLFSLLFISSFFYCGFCFLICLCIFFFFWLKKVSTSLP